MKTFVVAAVIALLAAIPIVYLARTLGEDFDASAR